MAGVKDRAGLIALVTAMSVLAGWNPAFVITEAQASGPSTPLAFSLPSQPIVPGGGDLGYLPGSGSVSPQGQYTYSIPLEVPAGRGGMHPSLSLSYSSEGGAGIVGVGWSLSGMSSISRCGQSLDTEGQVHGVHLTDPSLTGTASDRFCLDGHKLMAIQGVYGQVGTEYRTEEEDYSQILSQPAPAAIAQSANEPMFVVHTKSGQTLRYTALYGGATASALNGPISTSTQAILSWALTSQTDESGNGITYTYTPVTRSYPTWSGFTWGSKYAPLTQWELSNIVYTTAADGSDVGHRKVELIYEDLPVGLTVDFGFQAGAGSAIFQRLKTVRMSAPNPSTEQPVWEYDITYTKSSFSHRSLVDTIKRCALLPSVNGGAGTSQGSCTWNKTFTWTNTPSTTAAPFFSAPQTAWTGQISGLDESHITQGNQTEFTPGAAYNFTWPDNPPVVRVLDADGDGRDDVLLQTGGPGNPNVLLFTAAPNTAPVVPVSTPLSTQNTLMVGAYTPSSDNFTGNREALQYVMPLDFHGVGTTELYLTQQQVTENDVGGVDTNNTIACQDRIMRWGGSANGFVNDVVLPSYDCTNFPIHPNANIFVDLDGDGRPDRLQGTVIGIPVAQGSGTQPPTGLWQTVALNNGVSFATPVSAPPQIQTYLSNSGAQPMPVLALGAGVTPPAGVGNGLWSGCQTYAVDFSGDGHAQLFGSNATALGGSPSINGDNNPTWLDAIAECGWTVLTGPQPFTGKPVNLINQTVLDTYDAPNGQWQMTSEIVDSAGTTNTTINPSYPVIGQSLAGTSPRGTGNISETFLTDTPPANKPKPSDPNAPNPSTTATLIFGDFNGDGLEDVIEPDLDPVKAASGQYWLRWNTGNGFGPRTAILMPFGNSQSYYSDGTVDPYTLPVHFQTFVTDVNHDGRADIVIFTNTPSSSLIILYSNGDGTFSSETWSGASNSGGVFTHQGRSTGAIGDFNGDGLIDFVWLQGDDNEADGYASNTVSALPNAKLQVMTQVPQLADRINAVYDEPTVWPREAVTYSLQWSDKPELVAPCTYPLRCQNHGSVVVREVDYRDTVADLPTTITTVPAHALYYSYEDPVSDLRGRGGLGFRKVRVWDPTRLRQSVTEYDNRTCAPNPAACATVGTYYPGAMRPKQVTTVTVIPSPSSPQNVPFLPRKDQASPANARVVQTQYTYQTHQTNNALTYVVQPLLQVTSEWEQTVDMAASVLAAANPTSDYLWSPSIPYTITTPPSPFRVSTTQIGGPDVCNNGAPSSGIDAYGNVLQSTNSIVGGITSLSCATYTNDPSTWQIGLQLTSSVTVTDAGASVKRGSQYDYDTRGLLAHTYQQQFVSPSDNNPSVVSTTTLGRDAYGNVTSIATQALGSDGQMQTRQINIEYDALWSTTQPNERIFPSQQWMPTPYPGTSTLPSSWTVIHPAYGVMSGRMDVNGVQSSSVYDDQGRPVQVRVDGQAPTNISYAPRPEVYGGSNGLIVSAAQEGQIVTHASDAGGRSLGMTHQGFNGALINDMYVSYDLLGRTRATSRPYSGAGATSLPPANWPQTTVTYDGLDRHLITIWPDNTATQPVQSVSTPTFFTTTNQDPSGNQHQVTEDINGRVASTANLLAGALISTQYAYTALSFQITDPNHNVESLTYDTLGRVKSSVSPDTGTTTNITYDGFDELVSSTHKDSGAVLTRHYDNFGRLTDWLNTDGPTKAALTYDTQPNGLGKLATTTSSDGVYTVSHYDIYGRSLGMDETVDSVTYSQGVTYLADGRVNQVLYPGVPATNGAVATNPGTGMILQYTYTPNGYLSGVQYQTAQVSKATLLTINQRNNDDALLSAQLGSSAGVIQNSYIAASGRLQESRLVPNAGGPVNLLDLSYQYYPNGLVQARNDAVNGRNENYTYDTLNRLTTWELDLCAGSPCIVQRHFNNYAYDRTGNLLGVTSAYANNNNPTPLQTNTYGNGVGQPHALTLQVSGGVNGGYKYDTHGRLVTGTSTGQINYNAFDLPTHITNKSGAWTLKYNAMGERVEKAGPDGRVITIGGYEQRILPGVSSAQVFQVPGIAQVQVDTQVGTTVKYEITDALGSVALTVDGGTGQKDNTFFYEPFGSRINADGSPFVFGGGYLGNVGTVQTGFTGQEHDDDWGMINFHGRMYSPSLKRFITADPLVSAPMAGQSWNPYSYVSNSPLNATDPSGLVPCTSTSSTPDAGSDTGDSGLCTPSGGSGASNGGGRGASDSCIGCNVKVFNENTRGPDGSLARGGIGPDSGAFHKGGETAGVAVGVAAGAAPAASGASDNGGTTVTEPLVVDYQNANLSWEVEKQRMESDHLLSYFEELSDYSPTLGRTLQQIKKSQTLVEQNDMKAGRNGVTFYEQGKIELRTHMLMKKAVSTLAHENYHMQASLNGIGQSNVNVQTKDEYIEAGLADEKAARVHALMVVAEFISSGGLTIEDIWATGGESEWTPEGQAFFGYAISTPQPEIRELERLGTRYINSMFTPGGKLNNYYRETIEENWRIDKDRQKDQQAH